MDDPYRPMEDPYAIWNGAELNKLQIWQAPNGSVIIENPDKIRQLAFTWEQWQRINEHVKAPDDAR